VGGGARKFSELLNEIESSPPLKRSFSGKASGKVTGKGTDLGEKFMSVAAQERAREAARRKSVVVCMFTARFSDKTRTPVGISLTSQGTRTLHRSLRTDDNKTGCDGVLKMRFINFDQDLMHGGLPEGPDGQPLDDHYGTGWYSHLKWVKEHEEIADGLDAATVLREIVSLLKLHSQKCAQAFIFEKKHLNTAEYEVFHKFMMFDPSKCEPSVSNAIGERSVLSPYQGGAADSDGEDGEL